MPPQGESHPATFVIQEDPEVNLRDDFSGSSGRRRSIRKDILAYALHAITILSYYALTLSLNPTSTLDGPSGMDMPSFWAGLACIFRSALCKALLLHCYRSESHTWGTRVLLQKEFYMALFQIVFFFGHAYSSELPFQHKTFIATLPMVVYAMGLYAVLDHYGRAPSPRDLFSIFNANQQ